MAFVLAEYDCAACGRFESLETRPAPEQVTCPTCNGGAQLGISAPKVATRWGTVERGSGRERPPGALDTRSIADGQSVKDWRAARRTERRKQKLMTLPKSVRDKVAT